QYAGMFPWGDFAPRSVPDPLYPMLLLSNDSDRLRDLVCEAGEDIRLLADGFLAGEISGNTLRRIKSEKLVERAELMNPHASLLDVALPTIGLPQLDDDDIFRGKRGEGVLVAIIDLGFDLSHPCFRDSGGRLRVDALLDQTTSAYFRDRRVWSCEDLES